MRAHGTRDMRTWGFVDAIDAASGPELDQLSSRLAAFYSKQASEQGYWEEVDARNEVWNPSSHPFHCDLAERIAPGSVVVDFGCGSAHAVRNLKVGVKYTGVEGSATQVEVNRQRFPQHQFLHADMLGPLGLDGTADWALSFFAIEHCVRPDLLLRRMLQTCRPGGRIAVLCPNFARGMNSLRSGWTAVSKREKLRRLRLLDVLASYIEEKWVWPARVRAVHQSSMEFPIYLRPRCLDAPWFSDSDAVYLVSEPNLKRSLLGLGCTLEREAEDVSCSADLKGAIVYLIVNKPT